MLKFKEWLEENKKIKIKDTAHSIERAIERGADKKELDFIITKTTEKIKSDNLKSNHYLFFSKSQNRGIVTELKDDVLVIITILPKGRKQPKDGTKLDIVENLISDELVQYLSDILDLKLSEKTRADGYDIDTEYGFTVYLVNNKIYDISIVPIIIE